MTAIRRLLWVLTVSIGLPALLIAQQGRVANSSGKPAPRGKRVAPPKFEDGQIRQYFFGDVFTVLEGERSLGGAPLAASPAAPGGAAGETPAVAQGAWAAIISRTALEDEVKAIKLALDAEITTPSDFRGRGYKVARRDITSLAVMFGIIAQYDGDVRFKDSAALARETFARTAANCKVGTIQVYKEVKERTTDLNDLLNGNELAGKPKNEKLEWREICDRSPLMQRFEMGFNERVRAFSSSEEVFKKEKDRLRHEAEIIAAIASVLMQSGMEDADAEDYAAFCKEIVQAGRDVVDGCKLNNYTQVREALGKIDKACTTCHDFYKG